MFATRSTPLEGSIRPSTYTFLRDLPPRGRRRTWTNAGVRVTRGALASIVGVGAHLRAAARTRAGPAPEPEPTPPPPADRDGDGVIDDDDACPTAGVKTDDPKTNGCPPDRDHDGILDSADACPDVAGHQDRQPEDQRLSADPDRDKDGIPNDQDACPDAPGPKNRPEEERLPAGRVVGKRIVILEQVKFATGSANIFPASDAA